MVAVVRYLGPDEFGLYSYAISFYGLFVAFISLGLESISIRELVKYPNKKDEILGSVFYTQLVGAVIAILFISLALLITSEELFTSILILIISASSFFQTFNVIDYYFRSTVKAKYSVYVLFSSVLIISAIKFTLIIIKAPLIYFVTLLMHLEFVFNSIGYFIVYHLQKHKISKWKFDKKLALSLLKDSWPLILSGVVVSIYMKVDQVIIKKMLDAKEVGYYAAAVRLSESWYFIPVAISNAIFPAIVNAKNISLELYKSRLQKLYDILAWMAIGISIPISFFATDIIILLYGKDYLPSATILTIYIWAGAAVFLGVASSQYLVTENLTKISLFRTSLGMIVNVVLNIILIPKYGIVGSAVATLISYSLATLSIVFFRKTSHQFFMMLKSITLINLIPSIRSIWHSRLNKK